MQVLKLNGITTLAVALLLAASCSLMAQGVPEKVYRADLVAYPKQWGFQIPKSSIILVTDEELEALADPDRKLNLSLGRRPREASLRELCERAKARGDRTLIVAFDHFFSQYRPGQSGKPRRLMPDMDEYVQRMAVLGRFAQGYGLGLELSLLSPLELGKAFRARTGESGLWLHYRKGLRDAKTGGFSVPLWQHLRWANNKGAVALEDAGTRVFAFRETPVAGTPYRVVNPADIVELTQGIQVERFEDTQARAGDFLAQRIRVSGRGSGEAPGLNRVLVVQQYRTPEMDYFSDKARDFLTTLVDKYAAAGVPLNALYSDEVHIQQDWAYFNHHDHGEFALRYVSPGLARRYAELYGAEFRDFAKFLVYFTYGQEEFAHDLSARQDVMHVFGPSPEEIRRTALFRSRYYHLLQDGVVDLFVGAKRYAERKLGLWLEARAHATWAQSPTIDRWNTGVQNHARNQYEYTSNFVWSNTVHQAASACYDYFKWGDFLTGGGNDHTEGGWLDRNYYAMALASSTGILNEVPYSYAAHWGMPDEISRRRSALVDAFGTAASAPFAAVQEMQHRDVDVLMLYPMDLVAVEERFGSWMNQYGYANLVTAEKLLERGKVSGKQIEMAGRKFTTLVATFEPFPSRRLLDMMRAFVEGGGRVIWSGPPPVLTSEGEPALDAWQALFGVSYKPGRDEGLLLPGRRIAFEGVLAGIASQDILTDFLVDRVYPVTPSAGVQVIARIRNWLVGTHRVAPGGGTAAFLGYRPRDDQSGSLGYESRNWFEVLSALGAYPPTGRFPQVNDNTESVSRHSDYLAVRFPNGATALAPHLRELEEGWKGGFARDQEEDRAYLAQNPPPPETIRLRDLKVNGHSVTYDGTRAVCFRLGPGGVLKAFAGSGSNQITIDGRATVFSDGPVAEIAWAPVAAERRVPGGAVLQIQVRGAARIHVPLAEPHPRFDVIAEGPTPGSRGKLVPSRLENGAVAIDVTPEISGRWLYLVPR